MGEYNDDTLRLSLVFICTLATNPGQMSVGIVHDYAAEAARGSIAKLGMGSQ